MNRNYIDQRIAQERALGVFVASRLKDCPYYETYAASASSLCRIDRVFASMRWDQTVIARKRRDIYGFPPRVYVV